MGKLPQHYYGKLVLSFVCGGEGEGGSFHLQDPTNYLSEDPTTCSLGSHYLFQDPTTMRFRCFLKSLSWPQVDFAMGLFEKEVGTALAVL